MARQRRDKQRGTAAIEMALSLIVIMLPLVLGMMDYGYYFYVSSTAAEAARVAARAAVITPAGTACATAGAGTTAARAAATNYMNQIGLGGSSNLFVTVGCATVPLSPWWTVSVEVNFPPAIGFIRSLMKPSTRTTGWVVFTQTVQVLGT
jgi:Flp pilus assembly protein TadG